LTYNGFLAGCIISLLVHEVGHIWAAMATGVRVKRIGMSWWGPYIVRESGPPAANLIVSAAGPTINLIAAAIAWHSWPGVAFANLVLGLSNLYPTPTSDGRRVLTELPLAWNEARKQKPVPGSLRRETA
jgi:Zn-dependent protease